MRRIIAAAFAAALLGTALPSGPVWAQANLRPDPTPRVPPQPGQSIPAEDALFLHDAMAASQGQAALGRLAADKVRDDALRTLSQGIAGTHRALAGELKTLTEGRTLPPADRLRVERSGPLGATGAVTDPADVTGGRAEEAVASLSKLDGEAFAKGYVEAELRLHDRLVDLYQTEASNTPDRELATFAITSLVAIQKDRDALRLIAGRFGIKAPAEGQPPQYGKSSTGR